MPTHSGGLALLDRASQLLSRAASLDDIKEVRDTAEAARTFAKAAQLGLELQNRAAELKLRAERKAGKFLADLHLRGGDRRSKSPAVTLTLDDLGVTKRQSELWQLVASVPDQHFDQYIRGKNELGQEVTASGLLRLAKSLRATQRPDALRRRKASFAEPGRAIVRAELLALISDLKSQCTHLAKLLKPFSSGDDVEYKTSERRFIARLTGEIEQTVKELEQHLWNNK
jgi:hypothetical protein